jgi:hypothetical protein
MGRRSIATIDSPEFLNITPYNPLISQCEIKVLYIGENRNRSFISKEVATEMANSLPGCPIVGYYREDKQDFGDHGDQVIFDGDGIHFNCLTKPYGFVAPDAKVWFQKFQDTDDFGNTVEREYLMTTGYLWTGQFPECQAVVDEGKPHSMELDEENLNGHWSENIKTGYEFFIINDAIFSKLCILGDDVEPCFEGSSVTAPEVSKSFSLDNDFKQTLFTMMQELKDLKTALEGGQQMHDVEKNFSTELDNDGKFTEVEKQNTTEDVSTETDFAKKEEEEKETSEPDDTSKSEDEAKEDDDEKKKFAKAEDEDEKKEEDEEDKFSKKEEDKDEDDKKDGEEDKYDDDKDDDDDKDRKYALLEEEHQTLQAQFSQLQEEHQALQTSYQALVDFKNEVDNEKKDALISSFYMLSDEDKKDVIENKVKYSLEEIESKLSVICYRKKVSFESNEVETKNNDTQDVTTYNLNTVESTPAWVKALKNTQKSRNI